MHTSEETGLPGSPITRAGPRRPNIKGWPGRMAIFQKDSAMPRASSTGPTRSWSPTDAPPMVTITSAPSARAKCASRLSRVSRAMPSSSASAPAASASAATPRWLEEMICPGPGRLPGATSSSPVEMTATRGVRRTGTRPVPHGGRERHLAGAEAPARLEQDLARAEIEARVADVPAVGRALAHDHPGPVALRCSPG